MSWARQRILVFFVPLLLAAPFLRRAYFVDDNYFVEIASWLRDHPLEPYHFKADDAGLQNRGWEENGFVRMVNPLVHQYYLAALMKVGGTRVAWLRLGCVLLSCLGALFILELARRWTYHPLLATVLTLATPVYWLTSYSLLIDGTLGFFFFGALYFFIRSMEKDSLPLSLASGLFMGLAVLTKYPGALIIPLTGLWSLLRWKKINRAWMPAVPWGMGLAFLLAYSAWTARLYGAPHILAASARMVHVYGWAKVLVFLVFFSGSTLLPLIGWRMVGAKIALLGGLVVFVLAVFFSSSLGGYTKIQSLLLGTWSVSTLIFLIALGRHHASWEFPKDHFLFLWVLGFMAMMLLIMGWVAVRYYMIVLPAVVFLSVRLMEMAWPRQAGPSLRAALGATLVLSGLLAYADYKQAAPSRDLPAELERAGFYGGAGHYYLGDSFTMSYLKRSGWIPLFPQTGLKPGDWVLAKQVTMPQTWFFQKPLKYNLRKLAEFNYPTRFPLKVMDNAGSGGFYASVWGALPFTISGSPWEKFQLFEIAGINSIPQ